MFLHFNSSQKKVKGRKKEKAGDGQTGRGNGKVIYICWYWLPVTGFPTSWHTANVLEVLLDSSFILPLLWKKLLFLHDCNLVEWRLFVCTLRIAINKLTELSNGPKNCAECILHKAVPCFVDLIVVFGWSRNYIVTFWRCNKDAGQ